MTPWEVRGEHAAPLILARKRLMAIVFPVLRWGASIRPRGTSSLYTYHFSPRLWNRYSEVVYWVRYRVHGGVDLELHDDATGMVMNQLIETLNEFYQGWRRLMGALKLAARVDHLRWLGPQCRSIVED